jgi:hypothetical protein
MRLVLSDCKDLELSHSAKNIAEILLAVRIPPASAMEVLGLAMILYQGKEVDQSWNNIKR